MLEFQELLVTLVSGVFGFFLLIGLLPFGNVRVQAVVEERRHAGACLWRDPRYRPRRLPFAFRRAAMRFRQLANVAWFLAGIGCLALSVAAFGDDDAIALALALSGLTLLVSPWIPTVSAYRRPARQFEIRRHGIVSGERYFPRRMIDSHSWLASDRRVLILHTAREKVFHTIREADRDRVDAILRDLLDLPKMAKETVENRLARAQFAS